MDGHIITGCIENLQRTREAPRRFRIEFDLVCTQASFPNVATKISGIATEADLMNWTAEDLKPYVDHALSAFGEDRVIFGGDWPPLLTANSTYARWVHTLDDLTTSMGAAGQRKLFGDNARSFYHLPAA